MKGECVLESAIKGNYYGSYRKITDQDKENGIEMRWAGYYQCSSQYLVDRVHERYMLGYIEKGSCEFLTRDSERVFLGPGDIFFYRPYEKQWIKTVPEDPITYQGVCFSGKVLDDIIARSGIRDITFIHYGIDPVLNEVFSKLIDAFVLEYNTFHLLGSLLQLIGCINHKGLSDYSSYVGLKQNPQIIKTADYIRLNYKKRLSIDELSELSGYSVSRFQYLFHQYYGMSTIEFLINERIKHAKEMLRFDPSNISEIALSVGYDDPYYFSKLFKKQVKMSPREYRNKFRNVK